MSEQLVARIGHGETVRAIRPLPHEMKNPQVLSEKELGEWRRRELNPRPAMRPRDPLRV